MPSDPDLVPRSALSGKRVAISVSASADLARLGLDDAHLDLAVAELTRAIVFAGGIVVYGGGIGWGFTSIVIDEAERYGATGQAFEHYVPYAEHADVPMDDLRAYESELSIKARVRLIDADGVVSSVADAATSNFTRGEVNAGRAFTTMRQITSKVSDARVILGGKVTDFAGFLPGVAEEAAATFAHGKPLYVAGGFGGASALVGRITRPDLYSWLPSDLPTGLTADVQESVAKRLRGQLARDGLSEDERALLAQTNRPSDVATLSILGLSRLGL